MLSTLIKACTAHAARRRTAAELRRFHEAELREIGVSDSQIEAFLSGRR